MTSRLKDSPRPTGPELLKPGQTRADYLALRDEWYGKLRESGFVDHECFGHDGDCLPIMRSTPEHSVESFVRRYEATTDYYARCRQFQHTRAFLRLRTFDKVVWRLHCDGLSRRRIATQLRDEGVEAVLQTGERRLTTEKLVRDALHRALKALRVWWTDPQTVADREREQRARRDEEA